MSNVVGDGSGPINIQKDVPLFTKPNGKAFGQNYWTAPDTNTYDITLLESNKYETNLIKKLQDTNLKFICFQNTYKYPILLKLTLFFT